MEVWGLTRGPGGYTREDEERNRGGFTPRPGGEGARWCLGVMFLPLCGERGSARRVKAMHNSDDYW